MKHLCFHCQQQFRKVRFFRNNFCCYNCWRKLNRKHIIWEPCRNYKGSTLEEALARTYEVKWSFNKELRVQARCSFPSILKGRKFKIQLVE